MSKYSFIERPTGVTISAPERNTVHVDLYPPEFPHRLCIRSESGHLSSLPSIMSNDCDSCHNDVGLFEFRILSDNVVLGLMAGWQPRADTPRRFNATSWAMYQTHRAINARLYTHWQRLLTQVDPTVVAVERKLFSSALYQKGLSSQPAFYKRPYLIQDVLKYRAAACALAMAHRLYSDLWKQGDYSAILDRLEDWRSLFSATGKSYRSLNITLDRLPGQIPVRMPLRLRNLILPRPITDRLELLCVLAAHHRPQSQARHSPIFLAASHDEIVKAMYLVANRDEEPIDLRPRRTRDVASFVDYLQDYPEPYHGNLIGLARRSIRWHAQFQRARPIEPPPTPWLEVLVQQPPIPLPDHPQVRFLGTVKEIYQEAKEMQHCVASYASAAVGGDCYLFHVTFKQEDATVEVTPDGMVQQAYGPRNETNEASRWGAHYLSKWAQPMQDLSQLIRDTW